MSNLGVLMMLITGIVISAGVLGLAACRFLPRRFVVVRPSGPGDCGPAAMAAIATYYGRPIGLEQIRELTGTDRIGTNLLGLLQAAEKLGFSAKGVKGPYEALPQVPLPAIAHVKTEEGLGHF